MMLCMGGVGNTTKLCADILASIFIFKIDDLLLSIGARVCFSLE